MASGKGLGQDAFTSLLIAIISLILGIVFQS